MSKPKPVIGPVTEAVSAISHQFKLLEAEKTCPALFGSFKSFWTQSLASGSCLRTISRQDHDAIAKKSEAERTAEMGQITDRRVGGHQYYLKFIDRRITESKKISDAGKTAATIILLDHFEHYLEDRRWNLEVANNFAAAKREERSHDNVFVRFFKWAGIMNHTTTEAAVAADVPKRPEPTRAEVGEVLGRIELQVRLEELDKMLSDVKLADLERRLAALKRDDGTDGRGSGGAAGGGGKGGGGSGGTRVTRSVGTSPAAVDAASIVVEIKGKER